MKRSTLGAFSAFFILAPLVLSGAAGCGGGAATPPAGSPPRPAAPAANAPTAGKRPEGEWTQFRGADRSGVSSEKGLLKQWPADGPPLVWKATDIGSGFSSVAVSHGRAYTQGKHDGNDWIVALDIKDGKQLWSKQIGAEYSNDKGGGPRSTPTVVGDAMYVFDASGDLWCLATEDGAPRWHVNVLEKFGGENLKWGLSESPLVEGDKVIVATGSKEGSIVAFDTKDGHVVWQSKGLNDEPSYASALAVTVGGVRQLVNYTGSAAVGVRLSDGKPLWRYEKAANDTANCAAPLFRDDYVFFTSGYDTGAALLHLVSQGESTSAEEVYFTREMMNHHGGVVLVGDNIYGFSGSILTCLDFKTGAVRWKDRSVGKGSITAADGMLYVFSETGIVGLVRATPESYQEVSRFSMGEGAHKTWAYPVVVGGRLYIRVREELSCFDVTG
jgi:outer membrane protein assembly factor BamB